MKLLCILPIILLAITPGALLAQGPDGEPEGTQLSIGLGLLSNPTYKGNDSYQLSLFPSLSLNYGDRFSASLRGIKYTALLTESWQVGTVLTYDFGREEEQDGGPFTLSGGLSNDLLGLGDIDGTLTLGAFVEYQSQSLSAEFEIHQGVDGGYDGLKGEAKISYRQRVMALGPPIFLSIGPAISFSDNSYASTFFDVTAEQSAISGISEFDADGGLNSVGLHAAALMPLTKSMSILGLLTYDQLVGDTGRSSLVKERGSEQQITTGAFVNYRF